MKEARTVQFIPSVLCLLFIVIIGLSSITAIKTIYYKAENIEISNFSNIYDVLTAFQRENIAIKDSILGIKSIEDTKNYIDQYEGLIDTRLTTFERTIVSSVIMDLYNALQENIKTYRDRKNDIIPLIEKHKDAEAVELLNNNGQLSLVERAVEDSINEISKQLSLSTINKKESNQKSTDRVVYTQIILIILGVFVVLLPQVFIYVKHKAKAKEEIN